MKYLILTLYTLTLLSGISQNQIIDAKSKEPVSYAHIKSVNESKGVLSDYQGYFVLDTSFRNIDSIVISCIGYHSKKILVSQLVELKQIELTPSLQNLTEVIISSTKIKTQLKTLGITKKPKKRFSDYMGSGNNGEEKATWIPNDYSITGYLKNINVFVSDLGYPDAHFRIHVYACNSLETKPGRELTKSNIITSSTKGNEWITVDVSGEHIQIGEHGCFIGIEWFDSPKSKYFQDTVYSKNSVTWDERKSKYKDTVLSRVRKGNGAVLGSISQKYRISKNKNWYKVGDQWQNRFPFAEAMMYKTDTSPDGTTTLNTPDNHYIGVMCIHIDVSFPKNKIDLTHKAPKKRKLNKLKKVKQDLTKYPQYNIHELFTSLIKALENDDIVYVLKFLCVYEEGQLDLILSKIIDEENENFLSNKIKAEMVRNLKELQAKFNSAVLTKVDDKHFTLSFDNETYNLIVHEGLWKINPIAMMP
ncbi:carboxypeptidase-like regulatory domain-containing protein, partial [Lishizhenia sp.]|uniref:carboxypeptidase-like regulatory domain-containing protein n=1 Tax=Lishizhenia sp. TaxID=2497594 RepID=UPI00299EFEF9